MYGGGGEGGGGRGGGGGLGGGGRERVLRQRGWGSEGVCGEGGGGGEGGRRERVGDLVLVALHNILVLLLSER